MWELRRLGLLSAKRVLKINVRNLNLVLAVVVVWTTFFGMVNSNQFLSSRLARLASFLDDAKADGYQPDIDDVLKDIAKYDNAEKALEWLASNMGDKTLKDAWSIAQRKADAMSRNLTYSANNRSKNAKNHSFWFVIADYCAWLSNDFPRNTLINSIK